MAVATAWARSCAQLHAGVADIAVDCAGRQAGDLLGAFTGGDARQARYIINASGR
jgi:hypothetical protein